MTEGITVQEDDGGISSLAAWAIQHGAALHARIEIYRDEVTGLSFRVKPSLDSDGGIKAGTEVVKCPIGITLSYLNALEQPPDGFHKQSQGPPLPQLFVSQSPPHVVGRVLLIREYLLREKSFWWPYIRTLPQPTQSSDWILPPVWPSGDREYLEGTNLERAIEETRDSLKREYGEVKRLLSGMENLHEYTRNLYDWAYCVFSSRSFTPSLVIPDGERIQLPVGRKLNDFSLLLPLLDIGNHAITSKYAWVLNSKGQTCDFVAYNSYLPGEQVFNNYGLKTNGALLIGYGFMIPETHAVHNDYIHLRKRAGPASPGSAPPTEFFMSLRPMRDPSSILGKAVQTITMPDEPVHAAFAHVQDGLIWDIVVAQTTSEQRSALFPTSTELSDDDCERDQLRQFLTGKVSEAAQPLLEQIMAVIYNKALQELERLNETEYEPPSSDETSDRIQLALQYRTQCRKTLEAVLESIQSSFPEEG